jgi:MGT family glycosyltransferase
MDPAWDVASAELPDWWPGLDAPLVYVSFGTVAGSIPIGTAAYVATLEAVAELPVRALLTVGRDVEVDAFGEAPANVRIEQWVPQGDVLGHAAAVVSHGGSGSTLGALAAGLPQVIVPLFADQFDNAARVEVVGAGVAAAPEAGAIRSALSRVLVQHSFGATAQGVAAELRTHAPADAAVELLAGL